MAGKRGFGTIRKLPSGRIQAFYSELGTRHKAPQTFDTKIDAEAWLADERRLLASGTWTPPAVRHAASGRIGVTFDEYATAWLAQRDLKARTREHYQGQYERQIKPTFGHVPLVAITPVDVRTWYAATAVGKPTLRAHCYGLLRSILATAVSDAPDRGQPVPDSRCRDSQACP